MKHRAYFTCPLGGQPLKAVFSPTDAWLQIDPQVATSLDAGAQAWVAAVPAQSYDDLNDVDAFLATKGVVDLDWEAI